MLSLYLDRLRTIISYDRICVLDAGQIAVKTPFYLSSHKSEHIFHGIGIRYTSKVIQERKRDIPWNVLAFRHHSR